MEMPMLGVDTSEGLAMDSDDLVSSFTVSYNFFLKHYCHDQLMFKLDCAICCGATKCLWTGTVHAGTTLVLDHHF